MKRILAVILAVAMVLCCSGCAPIQSLLDSISGDAAVVEAEAIARFGFSTGTLFKDSEETLWKAEEFADKTAASAMYRGSLHYEKLTDREKTLYHAYEYALENGYTNILVDDLLIEDPNVLGKVLRYLALDSPLLEQNLRYETGSFTTYYPVEVLGLYERQAAFDGYYIAVKNFDRSFWEKKNEALTKAQSVVAALPSGLSAAEKAESLYRWLTEHTTYQLYDDTKNEKVFAYLYDAMITGKTQCDGFANGLSMLFRLAGINCVEKMYLPHAKDAAVADDGAASQEVGHTWNLYELDGVWYNADTSGVAHMVPIKESGMHAGYYFAFPDLLQEHAPNFAEVYPACETGLYMPIDAHLKDTDGLYETLKKAYNEHNKEWALVLLDTYTDKKVDTAMQKVANYVKGTIRYRHIPASNGRTALLLYKPDLLPKK